MARRKTYEEIKNDIESMGVELISTEYVNSLTPLKIKCKCGKEFERPYKAMRRGFGLCNECTEPIRRERGRSFTKAEVDSIMTKYGIKLVTKFEDITRVKMGLDAICKCGNSFRPTLHFLRKGESTRCQSCASKAELAKRKRNIEEVKEVVSAYGGTVLSSDYIDNKTELKIQCECGHIHYRRLNNILNYETAKCELCRPKAPKGETRIATLLRKNNIDFTTQEIFEDCKLEGKLRFDFYLPQIKTVIEYDGIQHFEPVKLFGGIEEFELTQKRDQAKNEFCRSNNLRLIRISYKNYKDIESILVNNKIIPSQAS